MMVDLGEAGDRPEPGFPERSPAMVACQPIFKISKSNGAVGALQIFIGLLGADRLMNKLPSP
jgi:hypothetical protein